MSGSERSSRPVWLGEDLRGWDHVRVHLQLVQDPRIDAEGLAVYLGIAVHAEVESGRARPSRETLAGYARISERTVTDRIHLLEELGYISVEHRSGKASVYRLLPPPVLADTPAGGAEVPVQEVQGSDPDPGTSCSTPLQDVPDTPAGDADELEPRTRTKNYNPAPPASPTTPEALEVEMVDAVLAVCGLTTTGATRSAFAAWRRACRELTDSGATTDEVRTRAFAYRQLWPKATLTPSALARHWSECIATAPAATPCPISTIPPPVHVVLDPVSQARAAGRSLAFTDFDEDLLDEQVPWDPAQAEAFLGGWDEIRPGRSSTALQPTPAGSST